jgi:hypothetical protein
MDVLGDLPGPMISVLRQELDSLVRIVFVLAQKDPAYRRQLIGDSVSGRRWCHHKSRKLVTDREMVELTGKLHGWTKSVYSFGCAFIHLSNLHDHSARDPLGQITETERSAMLSHLRAYHGGPDGAAAGFRDIIPYVPRVFSKISDNLECYVKNIEQDRGLES